MRGQVVAFVVSALAAVTLTGCSAGDGADESSPAGSHPVVVPGGPGEQARTVRPDEVRSGRPAEPNAADLRFVRMMIPHHRQALAMTALAPQRVHSGQVRAMAERIEAGQGPEISAMQSWLRRTGHASTGAGQGGHGQGEHGQGGHGQQGQGGQGAAPRMAGMASPEQMNRLKASTGERFDDLFLDLMTTHHRGAVTMSTEVLTSGSDVTIQQLAQDILTTQKVEIGRMEALRGG